MASGEIGTGLTFDSQYVETYNSQYIKIVCIYIRQVYFLFLTLPVYQILVLSIGEFIK